MLEKSKVTSKPGIEGYRGMVLVLTWSPEKVYFLQFYFNIRQIKFWLLSLFE